MEAVKLVFKDSRDVNGMENALEMHHLKALLL
jgi:hypothetical protein